MKFEVMSRQVAEQYSRRSDIDKTLMISISDIGSSCPDIDTSNPSIVHAAFLRFDDVDVGDPHCITGNDAKHIIEVYNQFKNSVDRIVVHCEAGISRSSGVCAALMKIHDGDDMAIFSVAKYCPNMTCYRRVLEAYYGKYDEEEAQKKYDVNTQAYLKQEGLLDD